MKLSDLQEAQYATPSSEFTKWVRQQLQSNVKFREHPLEDLDDVREAVHDLIGGFGKPDGHGYDGKMEYWMWSVRHKGDTYSVVVNTAPEMFIEKVIVPIVPGLNEARYHGLHPLVQKIKDIVDNEERITTENDFWSFAPNELQAIINDMDKTFGQAEDHADLPEDKFWHGHTKDWTYFFAVGHDDEEEYKHDPYGINIVRYPRT